ncbi:MAG: response regulator transcription factor [Deltaproteobacteria bacterium]|nr:response regulator transcription factor [Deltaproteobacteria bacterium]
MINLIVADDHDVIREALCEMLRSTGKYNIAGQANDGEKLLNLLDTLEPDLVIMDVSMPKLDGIAALRKLKEEGAPCQPPILVLSACEEHKSVKAALSAGAKGYIPKNASFEELEFAITSILEGKTYLSPSVTASLMSESASQNEVDNPLSVLTKRELEILKYLADGYKNRTISKLLHISIRTVDTHRSNILKKLKLHTNAELAKLAMAHGLISV